MRLIVVAQLPFPNVALEFVHTFYIPHWAVRYLGSWYTVFYPLILNIDNMIHTSKYSSTLSYLCRIPLWVIITYPFSNFSTSRPLYDHGLQLYLFFITFWCLSLPLWSILLFYSNWIFFIKSKQFIIAKYFYRIKIFTLVAWSLHILK